MYKWSNITRTVRYSAYVGTKGSGTGTWSVNPLNFVSNLCFDLLVHKIPLSLIRFTPGVLLFPIMCLLVGHWQVLITWKPRPPPLLHLSGLWSIYDSRERNLPRESMPDSHLSNRENPRTLFPVSSYLIWRKKNPRTLLSARFRWRELPDFGLESAEEKLPGLRNSGPTELFMRTVMMKNAVN